MGRERPRHLRVLTCALCFAMGCGGISRLAAPTRAQDRKLEPTGGAAAFERMKAALDGAWVTSIEKTAIRVRYRTLSGGSALAESFVTPSGRETMTVFHPDGERLIATHYCAQGNQPRLHATELGGRRVAFELDDPKDVSNLAPGQSVLVRLVLDWSGGNPVETELYRQPDGSLETTDLRMAPAASASVSQSAGGVPALAAIELRYKDNLSCSGVRIAKDLVLSAAHCSLGFGGGDDVRRFRWSFGGSSGELERAEIGSFDPKSDQLHDWMVLRGKLPDGPLAQIVTAEELAKVRRVGDDLRDRSVRVVLATFPDRAARLFPRPAIPGDGLFVSQGFAKSTRAYRVATVLASRGVLYDDQSDSDAPPPPRDIETAWAELRGQQVGKLFDGYARIEGAILYHSADYAPGSSGGGGFLDNGHLIGIVPMGASPKGTSRAHAFLGVGQLFAVDVICRESSVLKDANVCPSR